MNRPHLAPDEQLMRRIYNEFLEMPGLQLTARQAQRLFGLTEQVCSALLASLVDHKFLVLRSDGRYARLSDGRVLPPNPVFHGVRAMVKRTA